MNIIDKINKRLNSEQGQEARKKICENMEKRLQEIDKQKNSPPKV